MSGRKSPSNHGHLPDERLGAMLDDRDRQFEQQRGKLNKIGTIALAVILVGGSALFFSSSENRSAAATFVQLVKEANQPAPAPPPTPPAAPGATPTLKPDGLLAPEDARFAKEIFQFIQAPNHSK